MIRGDVDTAGERIGSLQEATREVGGSFGALLAAGVPVLLGLSAVAAPR